MWTPDALRSEARGFAGDLWRLVEAQHRTSTRKLVDSLAEQAILEEAIEDSKPAVPEPCRHLHPLLYTPFRYGPYRHGSRFRRAHQSEGAFYAAPEVEVSVAETAFYALLFFREALDAKLPARPSERTAFRVAVDAGSAVDLTKEPFRRDRALWTHPTDYAPTQSLADTARGAAVRLILYESVRDPGHRPAAALLDCRAFAAREPDRTESWRFLVRADGVEAWREFPYRVMEFRAAEFAADPRIGEAQPAD
jgi:hypothetical protein